MKRNESRSKHRTETENINPTTSDRYGLFRRGLGNRTGSLDNSHAIPGGGGMKVVVRVGEHTYSEEIDMDAERKGWDRLMANGANPELAVVGFEKYHRPLKKTMRSWADFEELNGNHFVYGWFECFTQSENVPAWLWKGPKGWVELVVE